MGRRTAKLALEDGTVFTGRGFGAAGTVSGEVCFNTSMAGYQEILTDPSYCGQIVTMSYPLIGNYGVNQLDTESRKPQVEGFVVRELSPVTSNFRSEGSLSDYLGANQVVGIEGIDTRALVRKLRIQGAMKGVLSSEVLDDAKLVGMAAAVPGLVGRDLVKTVTSETIDEWDEGFITPLAQSSRTPTATRYHVAALDCGAKRSIFRNLVDAGCKLTVFPATASAEQIRHVDPDGVFISNGPGDPAPVDYAQNTIQQLMGETPMFGICLGHQLMALALGAKSYKLKFGHRGANQPVKNLLSGRVEITSQNHGFAVDVDSLASSGGETTHVNLNDDTLEGFVHREMPAFAVQYHPEASPGPHDANYLFDLFIAMMESKKPPTAEDVAAAQDV